MSKVWDAIIIGGGAAGLFCAGIAGQLGKKVLVLDHSESLGEKIRISGGGRCNFTNLHSSPANFLSLNPHFVKSALEMIAAEEKSNGEYYVAPVYNKMINEGLAVEAVSVGAIESEIFGLGTPKDLEIFLGR